MSKYMYHFTKVEGHAPGDCWVKCGYSLTLYNVTVNQVSLEGTIKSFSQRRRLPNRRNTGLKKQINTPHVEFRLTCSFTGLGIYGDPCPSILCCGRKSAAKL